MRKFVAFLGNGIPIGMGETSKGVGDIIHAEGCEGLFSADLVIKSAKDTKINGETVCLMVVEPVKEVA